MDWLPPRESNSVPIDLLLGRLGRLPPLLLVDDERTLFFNCFGRLLLSRSEGREPRRVPAKCGCCWSRTLPGPMMWESPRIKLDGADPRRLFKLDFNAKCRNAFSFSSSVLLSGCVVSQPRSVFIRSMQLCSGTRFSLD